MTVINQDRDMQMEFRAERDMLYTYIMFCGETFMGMNLMLRGELLGTFDSAEEIIEEMARIYQFPYEIYVVSGYSAWHEWEELVEAMRL